MENQRPSQSQSPTMLSLSIIIICYFPSVTILHPAVSVSDEIDLSSNALASLSHSGPWEICAILYLSFIYLLHCHQPSQESDIHKSQYIYISIYIPRTVTNYKCDGFELTNLSDTVKDSVFIFLSSKLKIILQQSDTTCNK